jgi:3-oxoadipate enol-lactonase
MPTVNANGVTLYYEAQGSGPETIVFAHGLLMSGRMFERQIAAFRDRYRCVAFDFRGQGRSEIAASGYDMDTVSEDAAALIESLGCAPCHFVGLSMGGFVGMRLAIRRPELLRSLILVETSAEPEPAENVGRYRLLNLVARWFGLRLVAGRVMPILFGQKFLNDPEREDERARWRALLLANDRRGITRAVTGVIERDGVSASLDRIAVPTLVVVGDQDVATVPEKAERIAAAIGGARLVVIPGAGHSSTIEEPAAVNLAIAAFLDGLQEPATGR